MALGGHKFCHDDEFVIILADRSVPVKLGIVFLPPRVTGRQSTRQSARLWANAPLHPIKPMQVAKRQSVNAALT
jgi:hypothetical protein